MKKRKTPLQDHRNRHGSDCPREPEDVTRSVTINGSAARYCFSFVRLLRPHQWIKNVLVFVPALASHRLLDPTVISSSVHAFFAFSVCASAMYVLNDTLDYRADRSHPRKKRRPIAAGDISPQLGAFLVTILIVLSLIWAWAISILVAVWLTAYILLNIAYSTYIKRTIIADIVIVTTFYLLRLMVGSAATGIAISPWLMAFCFAIFFSLAACKRYAEIFPLSVSESLADRRRGYRPEDSATIHMIGIAASFSAVVILGLYIDSSAARQLYHYPELLWLCCPLILYWLLRMWILARRGKLVDDPLVVATNDWRAWCVLLLTIAIVISAGVFNAGH